MPIEQLRGEIARVLREMGVAEPPEIVLERPRNPEHGDFASNVAMTLAKPLRRAKPLTPGRRAPAPQRAHALP